VVRFAAYLLLAVALLTARSYAQDDDASDPAETDHILDFGAAVKDFYAVVSEDPKYREVCEEISSSLNRPKVYDQSNPWDVLVGTNFNYIWDQSAGMGDWQHPETVGDIEPQLERADRLKLDLNGDGSVETVVRIPNLLQGHMYTQLFIESESSDGAGATPAKQSEIAVNDAESAPPLNVRARSIVGDFYVADLMRVSGSTYLIAAGSVGMHWQPQALVFAIDGDMRLNAICHFRANYTL
jgi:hypothetical protein